MGRGLSRLQKTILVRALQNHVEEDRDPEKDRGADVYHAEILADYFGWKLPASYYEWKDNDLFRGGKHRRYAGSQKFSKEEIGEHRYVAAQAAVSRAMGRLEQRGLVVRMVGRIARWAGANLTDSGLTAAGSLSVNSMGKFPQS